MRPGQKNILVVEDDETLRSILVDELTERGHEVIDACNGKVALSVLEDYHPDLIITDLSMPEMDGLELLSHLGKKDTKHHIIAMTAGLSNYLPQTNSKEDALLKAADLLGATRTLAKPFTIDLLHTMVDDIVGDGG